MSYSVFSDAPVMLSRRITRSSVLLIVPTLGQWFCPLQRSLCSSRPSAGLSDLAAMEYLTSIGTTTAGVSDLVAMKCLACSCKWSNVPVSDCLACRCKLCIATVSSHLIHRSRSPSDSVDISMVHLSRSEPYAVYFVASSSDCLACSCK